jgi:hypothetical protein
MASHLRRASVLSIALFAGAAASLVPRAALAQDEPSPDLGADEVTLKNGGMVRGTVVSVEPGTKVVIVEAGAKDPRTIPWSEVADVERGKYKPSSEERPKVEPGAAGPGYEDEDEEAPAKRAKKRKTRELGDRGVVRLHVESPEPVQIYQNRIIGGGYVGGYAFVAGTTQLVCSSPCGEIVDLREGDDFVVDGDMPAKSFSLDVTEGDVTATVSPGSTGGRIGGIVMISLGGASMLGGASTLLTGALIDESDWMVPGGVMLGAGAAVLVGGIVTLVMTRTTVELTPGAPSRAAAAPRYWLGEF